MTMGRGEGWAPPMPPLPPLFEEANSPSRILSLSLSILFVSLWFTKKPLSNQRSWWSHVSFQSPHFHRLFIISTWNTEFVHNWLGRRWRILSLSLSLVRLLGLLKWARYICVIGPCSSATYWAVTCICLSLSLLEEWDPHFPSFSLRARFHLCLSLSLYHYQWAPS